MTYIVPLSRGQEIAPAELKALEGGSQARFPALFHLSLKAGATDRNILRTAAQLGIFAEAEQFVAKFHTTQLSSDKLNAAQALFIPVVKKLLENLHTTTLYRSYLQATPTPESILQVTNVDHLEQKMVRHIQQESEALFKAIVAHITPQLTSHSTEICSILRIGLDAAIASTCRLSETAESLPDVVLRRSTKTLRGGLPVTNEPLEFPLPSRESAGPKAGRLLSASLNTAAPKRKSLSFAA